MRFLWNNCEFDSPRSFLEWVWDSKNEWEATLDEIGDDVTLEGKTYGEGYVLRRIDPQAFLKARDDYIDQIEETWTDGEIVSMIVGDYGAKVIEEEEERWA